MVHKLAFHAAWVFALLSLSCASSEEYAEIAELKWPRQFDYEGSRVVMYDPQVDSWEDHEVLRARSAVAVTPRGSTEPAYGIVEYQVATEVNVDARQVLMKERKLTEIRFQGLTGSRAETLQELTRKVIGTSEPFFLALDFVLAYRKDHAPKIPSIPVNMDPPPIFVSYDPAVLVIFMGEPEFKPIEGTGLQFATNTNWDLVFDPAGSRYFLLNGNGWLATADLKKGPWQAPEALPPDFTRLPSNANWSEVKKFVPGARNAAPRIVVATQPAELILIEGRPTYAPIPGTRLSYVANTKSQLFFDQGSATYYFLTSGRWFRARSLEGPWSGATADLPPDFATIPPDGPKAEVRVSVPGTQEAMDAVLLAVVPRKATVKRSEVKIVPTYDGAPQFAVVEGAKGVSYAVNSPYSIFLVEGKYYCCQDGVWFEAGTATGPWVVCVAVPPAIYTIPPTHPKHNVTYVYVYDSTPDVVIVGYTSGYTGCYVSYGVVVFGCGYPVVYATPYWHYHYHVHYYAYGCGAYYHAHSGVYYRGAAVYGPYGGAGYAAAYNPHTGVYSRSAYAYGPYGSRYAQTAYNPYTGTSAARRGGSTPYSSWGQGVAVRGDDWVRGGYYSDSRGTLAGGSTSEGGRVIGGKGSDGQGGFVGQSGSGDVYAGRNGEVYKKTEDGWQRYGGEGAWEPVSPPNPGSRPATPENRPATPEARPSTPEARPATPETRQRETMQSLERDYSARTQGTRNARQWNQSAQSRGGWRR